METKRVLRVFIGCVLVALLSLVSVPGATSASGSGPNVAWYNANYGEGAPFYRSDASINKTVAEAVYGQVSQTADSEGGFTLSAECTDSRYAAGSGVTLRTNLKVADLKTLAILANFQTNGTGVFNLWFDVNKDGEYFAFDQDGKMTGAGGDNYALCHSYPADGEGWFIIDESTSFNIMGGGGVHTLADIADGDTIIPKDANVALWVGVWDSTDGDGAVSLTLQDVRFNRPRVFVVAPGTTVNEGDIVEDWEGNEYVYGFDAVDTIQEAIDAVDAGGVIYVAAGTYTEAGQLHVTKPLSILGQGAGTTTLMTSTSFTGANHSDVGAWILVDDGATFRLEDITLDGSGQSITTGILTHELSVIDGCEFKNIKNGTYGGVAINLHGADGSTVSDCTFSNIGRIGVYTGNGSDSVVIERNTYTGKGAGDGLDYAFEVGRDGEATIRDNTISMNKAVAASDGSTSAGILVTTYYGPAKATITDNKITDCTCAIAVGYDASDTSVVQIRENTMYGNDYGVANSNPTVAVDATQNYWGDEKVPDSSMFEGLVEFDPWLDEDMDLVSARSIWNTGKNKTYDTIQAAVSDASNGDVIEIEAGTYEEAQIVISKSIRLLGPNAGIDPNDPTATRDQEAVIKGQVVLDGGSVTIDGFEFLDNQTGRDFIAVYLKGSGVYTVENCIFNRDTGKSSDELGTVAEKDRMIRAIHIGPASCSAVIQNNLFTGSATNVYRNSSWRSAIWSDGVGTADNVVIEDNTFDTNRTALNLDNKVDNITLTGNKFLNNGTHVALGGSLGGEYTISGNEFAYAESVFNLSGVQSSFRLDATDNLYCVNATDETGDFKRPSEMTLDELFLLESSMYHKGKSSTKGLARILDDTVFVTPTGGSIQQAVDVADAGDTIYVRGTITVTDPITVSKANLVIKGEGPDNTVIETSGSNNVFVMSAQGATLQDLHIRKTDKGSQNLVHISASGVKIIGNEFSGQWQQSDSDVSRAMEIGGHLTGLEIRDNTIYGLRQPAYINPETSGTISNNTVSGTRGWVIDQANVTFTENKWGSGDSANYLDIAILAGTKPAYYSDILALSAANNGALIEDQRVSPAVLSSVCVDASAPLGGDGTVLKPYTTIGAALGRVVSGGTINVKPGTYVEHLVLSKPVTLKGPNFGINPNTETRGDEAIIGGDDQVGIIVGVQSPGVVIDGFTINSSDAGFPVYTGGGEGVVVDGLTISNNIVETGVRAVTIERSGSNVSVLNNRLTGASYGMRVDGPSYVNLKINGNVIEGSLTNSVAFNSTSVIEGFEFKNNTLTGRSANIAADIRKATVAGNVFTVTEGSYCLNINLHDDSVLSGNTFNGDSDTDGLRLWGTQYGLVPSSDTSIVGNTFKDCLRGITLSPGNRKIAIGSNTYSGVTTQVWNAAELNGLYYGIQEAINEASPGDTINVTVGDFAQNVTIPAGKNGLSLVGAGPSLTTISPASGNAVALMGNISATSKSRPLTGITVEGFTLHSVDGCAFIALSGTTDDDPYTADLTLRNIVVDGGQFGIVLNAVNGATLDNVQVKNITTQPAIGALEMTGVSNLVLRNSRFEGNALAIRLQKVAGYGSNADNTVSRTAFIGNTVAIENQDTAVSISAAQNYWNTGSMPPVSHIVGNVTYEPWYVSSIMTSQNLSNYEASGGGTGGGGTGGGGEPTPPTPPQPPVIAGAVSQPVETTTGGTVALEDNSAKVEVPPEALPEDVTVTLGLVTEMEQPTTGMVMIGGKVYEITAETEDGELVTEFEKPLTLTFTFTEEELEESGTAAEDLMVFYWDARAQAWIALPTTVDPETGTVSAITDHFTVFALMAKADMPDLPDVKGHWSETHVLRLVSLGIVGGYEDGTFRPRAGITREEFAKMVVLAAGLEPVAEPELGFADAGEIQGWARGYVAAAVEAGIITGLPENRFGPRERVTRQQAATMIGRALGVEAGAAGTPTGFVDDGDIESWALAAVKLAVEKGLVTGFPDNSFKPTDDVTRAQAASMLAKLTVVRLAD